MVQADRRYYRNFGRNKVRGIESTSESYFDYLHVSVHGSELVERHCGEHLEDADLPHIPALLDSFYIGP